MDLHPGPEIRRPSSVGPTASYPLAIPDLKLFQTLLDLSNDSILVVDPVTLRFLEANEKACSQLGYLREELLSLGVLEIEVQGAEASLREVLATLRPESSVALKTGYRAKDGRTFPVELSAARVLLPRDYIVIIARDITESERAEERRKEYERVIEGVDERILVVDREYRYVIVNRSFLNHRGLPREQVIGRTVAEVLDAKTFETVIKPKMDECFEGKVVHYELKYKYPKYEEKDFFASYFPIRGPDGVDQIACILRDITDRKQADESLKKSEEKFSKAFRQGPMALTLTSAIDHRYIDVNLTFERITGWTREEVIGRTPFDLGLWVHPQDRIDVVEKLLANATVGDREASFRVRDGSIHIAAISAQSIELNGETCMIAAAADITESKQIEEKLSRSEENYRLFVSESSEGICREEMDIPAPVGLPEDEMIHRILYQTHIAECNDALAAMYGYRSGTGLCGKRWGDLLPPKTPRNVDLTRQFVRSGFRLIDHESEEVDVNGHPKTFVNNMFGAVENGMLVRIWGIQRDITEKVRLEAERSQSEEELRRTVRELSKVTAELALAKEKLSEEKLYLEEEIDSELGFGEIIGRSKALKDVMHKVAKVAPSDATVLLLGETGTGKELVARALHRMSQRENKSFIKLNCAAIPLGLLESELFGHEKGAFTGAVARKLGRLELADKGTLFLDEIGEIPLSLQPKLLRVLQDMEFERLGSTQTLKVNFRLLAATNRDLLQSVKAREFRSDLYYRLNVFPIVIPPLRERRDDIRPLVEHFVRKFSQQMKKSITSIPSGTMEALVRWEWPGNIRELENFLERSVILSPGQVLQSPLSELSRSMDANGDDTNMTLRDIDRERIVQALRECGGRLGGPEGAAARLGLKRTTLQSKLDQLGIKPREHRV